ncbi:hypothetical protein HDE_06396 [Halotydeus destructor]|nr:hypothetical protein HDE_06396 [Halotydeus destructor]
MDKEPVIDTFEARITAESVITELGLNEVTLTFEPKLPVAHTLHQISLAWSSKVTIVSTHLPSHVCFGFMAAEPSLKVLGSPTMDRMPFGILSGIPENIVLEPNSGRSRIEQGTKLKIRVSHDLVMKLHQADQDSEATSEIELVLTVPLKPFDSFPIALLMKGKLANQRDTSVSEYTISKLRDKRREVDVTKSTSTSIQLIAFFVSILRSHTAHARELAEIILNGGSHQGFRDE